MNDSFSKFALSIGAIAVTLGSIMLMVIVGTLFGAIAGWIVGLVFGDTILGIAGQLGIRNIAMWQLGAFLGFVGGFMKTKVSAEVKAAS